MIIFNKKYFLLAIFIFSFLLSPLSSCHRKGPGYNPYLRKKPLQKQYRANKKAVDKGTKNYRKQMRKNRKHVFGKSKPANN